MWMFAVLSASASGETLGDWFAQSTHVFTATVEAFDSPPRNPPATRYGLRIGEELQGHVDTGYVVIETTDGFFADETGFRMTSGAIALAYREEIIVFASVGPSGRLDLRMSDLRILSRLPDKSGVMFAHRVGTGGWNRLPLSGACSTTGDLVDIQDSSANEAGQHPQCAWSAMVAWLRTRPTRTMAAATGDAPLAAGATPIRGVPQVPIYTLLARTPR